MPLFDTQKMFTEASVRDVEQEVSSEDGGDEEVRNNRKADRILAWITDPMMCPRLEEHATFMMTAEECKALRSGKQKGELGAASVSEQSVGRVVSNGQVSLAQSSKEESERGPKSFKSRLHRQEPRTCDSPDVSMRKFSSGDQNGAHTDASVRNPRAERFISRQQAPGNTQRAGGVVSPGSKTDSSVRGGEAVRNPLVKARMDADAMPKNNNNLVVVSERRLSVTSSSQQTIQSVPTARSKPKNGTKKDRNKDRDKKHPQSLVDNVLEDKQTKKKKNGHAISTNKQKKKKTKKERSKYKDANGDVPALSSVRSVDWNSSGDEATSTGDRIMSADDVSREPHSDDADWHRVIDPSFKIRSPKSNGANARNPANFELKSGSIPTLVADTAVPERRTDVQKGVAFQAWGVTSSELQHGTNKSSVRSVEPSKARSFRKWFCCGVEG